MSQLFNVGYFNEEDLKNEGFKSLGENVRISRNCTIIGTHNISIGDNVRIDEYSSIIASETGYVRLGSFIHIAGYCLLSGGSGVVLEDFTGLSHGVHIYSRTDDYSGNHLTNPTVPKKYLCLSEGEVKLKRHVIVGSGSVILPKVTIGEGCSIGALSLVTKDIDEWGVYFGCPVKRLKNRSKRLLDLEKELIIERARKGK